MKKADHQVVQQVLDGEMSHEEFERFQQRMRDDQELIDLYGDYAMLHHSLAEEYEDEHPGDIIAAPETSRGQMALVWAFAALIVVGALLFYRHSGERKAPALMTAATLSFSDDAVWHVSKSVPVKQSSGGIAALLHGNQVDRDLPDAALQPGGTLKLLLGQALLTTPGGNQAFLEGPATITAVDGNSFHLAEGRARFRVSKKQPQLVVKTPSISAVKPAQDFGVETSKDRPDELHVIHGQVEMRLNGKTQGLVLKAGEAGRVSSSGEIDKIAAENSRFPDSLEKFSSIIGGSFVSSSWRNEHGDPEITPRRVTGENYAAFLKLPKTEPEGKNDVLLATMEVGPPPSGSFHTDGWAGISFFSEGIELLFFGDCYGPDQTWALDVKQRIPIILPANPVIGPRAVTLRYDRKTGDVSLHEGKAPLSEPFCSGKIPAGTTFDEIRLGASAGAALSVTSLQIRTRPG